MAAGNPQSASSWIGITLAVLGFIVLVPGNVGILAFMALSGLSNPKTAWLVEHWYLFVLLPVFMVIVGLCIRS